MFALRCTVLYPARSSRKRTNEMTHAGFAGTLSPNRRPDRSMPTGLRRITSGGRFSAPAFPLPPHTNHSSPTNPLDDHSHANLGLALHLILWHHTRAAQECSVNLLSGNSRPTSMEIRSNVVVGSRWRPSSPPALNDSHVWRKLLPNLCLLWL